MAAVYEWVKNLVFFYIWLTAIIHILPKSSYRKYVKFFTRLLLVILLLTPVLEVVYDSDYLLDKVLYGNFIQEMDTIRLDMEGMEEIQKQAYLKKYQEVIGEDIISMAQEETFFVEKVEVLLTDDYQVENIMLVINLNTKDGIYIEKMILQDNSHEYPKVLALKEKIMKFYNMTEEQIQIIVQEG